MTVTCDETLFAWCAPHIHDQPGPWFVRGGKRWPLTRRKGAEAVLSLAFFPVWVRTLVLNLSALPAYKERHKTMVDTMRIAAMSDAEAVTVLTRMVYAKWIPVIGREPLPMKADHAAFIKENRVDLLFCGVELAAIVETIQRKEDILIENVAVDPRFQKRGYGRKMVAHAEKLAVEAGLDAVRLYTNSLFEENIRLYTSLGYEFECSGQQKLATALEFFQNNLSDSFGVKPRLY